LTNGNKFQTYIPQQFFAAHPVKEKPNNNGEDDL